MKKSDWYKSRIQWRAGKLNLEAYAWQHFLLSNEWSAKKILEAAGGHGVPLFIFWLNDDVWTLLTNLFLIGKLNGVLSSIDLDKLGEVSTVNDQDLPPNELKRRAEFISAGHDRTRFWTPAGNVHFSLRNILGMFPINVP
ncbi:hypothetical protein [Burkholderia cepacia]|uniref:hypothetical protein n=1 Tax=Burkholderia cepacia TaxID=292 RepID=UPI000A83773F|nr:hypothetical protein [Burkholderia cepacia]HDR9758215.1 hypothetical protein [Burkholderia cepacia ATCC 25416]MBY4712779.1 hypothetical protein [Burkholderia cepacia]MBY4735634.1 hypothetical protein [Burkholderia cepacia]MBY4745076.1 hypothetical protein [Burkholderia cepacia]MBY4756054.1 hypothetical protein [Burkholderia cepacia]